MATFSELALLATGFGLGLRHGIDWDHIAAITDITGTFTSDDEAEPDGGGLEVGHGDGGGVAVMARPAVVTAESRARFFLATLYAVGHALVVVTLGLLAIWTSTILPEWIDPLMGRVVGVTLLVLGIWIFYSLWRNGRNFRLRSRWMLVFAAVGRGWGWLKSRLSGEAHVHHSHDVAQYGPRTALGIGMIHGIGAETGSQALLLAGVAGATTRFAGSVLLLGFVVGLVVSNSLIAAISTFGFVSSQARQNIYVAVGVIAGIFSLVVGTFFTLGLDANLPDLQALVNRL